MKRSELLDELASRIIAIEKSHPVRVGIDGVDAAGKTTLADDLVSHVEARGRPVIRASIDGFHNPAEVRHQRGKSSPEGYYLDSFNYNALTKHLLIPLGPEGALQYRTQVFDFRTDREVATELLPADPNAVLLFDGVFLLRPELKHHWDFTIFVEIDFGVSLNRALERDVVLFGTSHRVARRYEERYIPGQRIYLERCQPIQHATVVFDNNDPLNPTIR